MPLRTGRRDWLWAATGVILVGIVIFGVYAVFFADGDSEAETLDEVAGVPCQSGEQLNYHGHVRVDIHIEGEEVVIPDNTGIRFTYPTPDPDGVVPEPEFYCIFWLHTHTGPLVHLEAPEETDFTLGQFFEIWGEPLSSTELLDNTVEGDKEVRAFVNGEPWDGNPADIPLTDQDVISVQYGPPFVDPPTELVDS
jgi:hypothetical protein